MDMNRQAIAPSYVLGCKELDNDHEVLLAIVATLRKALREHRGQSHLDKVVIELAAYCDAHFENEQDLMEKWAYPDAVAHAAEHERARHRLEQLSVFIRQGDRDSAKQALRYLEDWQVNHVAGTDRPLAEHLNKRRPHHK